MLDKISAETSADQVSGQPYKKITYTNGEGIEMMKITVGEDEFRFECILGSLIKAKNDSNIYFF